MLRNVSILDLINMASLIPGYKISNWLFRNSSNVPEISVETKLLTVSGQSLLVVLVSEMSPLN